MHHMSLCDVVGRSEQKHHMNAHLDIMVSRWFLLLLVVSRGEIFLKFIVKVSVVLRSQH